MPEITHCIRSYFGRAVLYTPENSSYELRMAEDGDVLESIIKSFEPPDKSLNSPDESLK